MKLKIDDLGTKGTRPHMYSNQNLIDYHVISNSGKERMLCSLNLSVHDLLGVSEL